MVPHLPHSVFCLASFLPVWREVYIAGMSLFGWWMAALMILSPLGALAIFVYERKRVDRKASSSQMTLERGLVLAYLAGCVVLGVLASRRVIGSREEYWVAGRSVGTLVNAMAIMATLASGGSIIGVMGLAYSQGIPATLALFAGAVVGFPLASVLVARPLRNFGKYTITDFLAFRYPHAVMRFLVPVLIVVSFTAYIVAQMKAAGITAYALLGIPYEVALTFSAVVFILYVSVGGMVAVTWTDIFQGTLMLFVVLGTAVALVWRAGSPIELTGGGDASGTGSRQSGESTRCRLSGLFRHLGHSDLDHSAHRHAGFYRQGCRSRPPISQPGHGGLQRHDPGRGTCYCARR